MCPHLSLCLDTNIDTYIYIHSNLCMCVLVWKCLYNVFQALLLSLSSVQFLEQSFSTHPREYYLKKIFVCCNTLTLSNKRNNWIMIILNNLIYGSIFLSLRVLFINHYKYLVHNINQRNFHHHYKYCNNILLTLVWYM